MADDALANRLFLIDGSSLAYRAFFALPESIAMRDGFPTNALYGFSQMLLKIVKQTDKLILTFSPIKYYSKFRIAFMYLSYRNPVYCFPVSVINFKRNPI